MCVALAGMMSMAVNMMGAAAQASAAQADYNAKAERYKQNVVNSWAAARDEQGQILLRQIEEQESTAQKIKISQLDEAEKAAESVAATAMSGVSGISVDNLTADLHRRGSFNRMVDRRNLEITMAQLSKEQEATHTRALNRINSVAIPTKPNSAAPFISALGSGLRMMGSA